MTALPETYTAAGLVDLQVNGYVGVDFNGDAAAWRDADFHHAREAMARRGVVACLITLVSDDPGRMVARAARYAELVDADAELSAFYPKLHIEGPLISAVAGPRGAHPVRYCHTPAELPDLIDRLRDAAGGRIGIVTVAPELPGAIDLIRRFAREGICMAAGHTEATADQFDRAVDAGLKMSTHLGNGSHPTLPRLDNYLQHQLADDRLSASFIADGHHIPFRTLKNFLRAKTVSRSVLITDAILAAEMPPGQYPAGEDTVVVSPEGRTHIPGQTNLAGAVLSLDRAVVNVCLHCGFLFEQAWSMASAHPAALAGLDTPPPVTVAVTADGFTRT